MTPDARFFDTLSPLGIDDLAALTGGEVVHFCDPHRSRRAVGDG